MLLPNKRTFADYIKIRTTILELFELYASVHPNNLLSFDSFWCELFYRVYGRMPKNSADPKWDELLFLPEAQGRYGALRIFFLLNDSRRKLVPLEKVLEGAA